MAGGVKARPADFISRAVEIRTKIQRASEQFYTYNLFLRIVIAHNFYPKPTVFTCLEGKIRWNAKYICSLSRMNYIAQIMHIWSLGYFKSLQIWRDWKCVVSQLIFSLNNLFVTCDRIYVQKCTVTTINV